ncbi:hypothetical protein KBY84_08040 [Cyanobium sp. N.Huapi 1H5]|uniref:hypothetical protein n=1 Tax=Cyanobium sp. N.Huapi 1H5 TaxID=2823719 RepID=UPI0020CFA240|nr:hypothetical protein [Cyanobium sp. N.Huapi 1H5]MCP9837443.1 hypothetical protein [Cyanobium sp. N.Huapi 1H5]
MQEDVQRFVFFGKPRPDNRRYRTNETATVIVFVADSDRAKALARFYELLEQHRWTLVTFEDKATLIEERVREEGGEVWRAFLRARERGYFLIDFPDNFGAGKKQNFAVLAPRIGEDFVDRIMAHAGGRRLTLEEKNHEESENADYLIDEYVVELKEIREEALGKSARQEKIAKLFAPYCPESDVVILDPGILEEADQLTYLDIVGRPIQNQIKKASGQLKRTKEHLALDWLRGAVIMMNTGYASLPADLFEHLCLRYASKDSSQIEEVFCVSSWFLSNGFDSEVFFQFYPKHEDLSPFGKRLFEAYEKQLNDHMTQWARSGFTNDGSMHAPMEPIAFTHEGQTFTWIPPQLPKSWEVS